MSSLERTFETTPADEYDDVFRVNIDAENIHIKDKLSGSYLIIPFATFQKIAAEVDTFVDALKVYPELLKKKEGA